MLAYVSDMKAISHYKFVPWKQIFYLKALKDLEQYTNLKRPNFWSDKWILHHHNVLTHTGLWKISQICLIFPMWLSYSWNKVMLMKIWFLITTLKAMWQQKWLDLGKLFPAMFPGRTEKFKKSFWHAHTLYSNNFYEISLAIYQDLI
jgi:hypothetical protein